MDDCELLREYVAHRSEPAFAALVERHLPLVYAVALRVVREPQTAEDVAQAVFIDLARRAHTVRKGQAVSGWLYRATQRDALDALRSEKRRHQRETEAMNLAEKSTRPEIIPEQLAPMLEQALAQLGRVEQDAVVLRYFEGKSLRETGAILALSEEAARKRVDRALDKMRAYFARAGITASAALLVSALSAHAAVAPVPRGLAAKITNASAANVAAAGGTSHTLIKIFFMNTVTKMAIVGIIAAGAAYLVGERQADAQSAGIPASNRNRQNIRSTPNTNSEFYQSSGKITRDQALQLWKTYMESPIAVVGSWMRIMDETNPADIPYLMDQLAVLPPSDARDFALVHLLLGLNDPDAAIALAGKTSSRHPTDAMNDIYRFMSEQDPATFVAELANLPVGQSALDAYYNVFSLWNGRTSSQNADAAALALTLPPGAMQLQALRGVAVTWANHDPAAALAWASSLPPEDSAVMNEALVTASHTNPDLAAQYVDQLADASARNQIISNLSETMSQHDPAAALDWLDQKATGDNYDYSVGKVFSALAKSNPATAATFLDKVTDPTVRQSVISNLAATWAKSSPQAALTWLQSLPESDAAIRDPLVQKLTSLPAGSNTP